MADRKPIYIDKRVGNIDYKLTYDPYREEAFIRATRDDGKYMGTVTAREVHGEPILETAGAYSKGGRGARVGTRMYEMMAAFACDRDRVLTSDTARTDDSEGFWNKQYRKGRADHECLSVRVREDDTIERKWRACAPFSPEERETTKTFTRYRLKPCPAPANLEGMRRKRTRRRR